MTESVGWVHHPRVQTVDVTASGRLTPRQYEAIRLRALGLPVVEVSRQMGVARSSVFRLTTDAQNRLGVDGLLGVWRELGWLRVPD